MVAKPKYLDLALILYFSHQIFRFSDHMVAKIEIFDSRATGSTFDHILELATIWSLNPFYFSDHTVAKIDLQIPRRVFFFPISPLVFPLLRLRRFCRPQRFRCPRCFRRRRPCRRPLAARHRRPPPVPRRPCCAAAGVPPLSPASCPVLQKSVQIKGV